MAGGSGEITVEIGGDTTKFPMDLKSGNTESRNTQGELKAVEIIG